MRLIGQTMSQENIELVERGLLAFNSGDLERILAFTHPDFEAVVPPELSAEPDTYRGHDGVRRYFDSFNDAMHDVHFKAERFWDAGDTVLVAVRLTAKGNQTDIPVEQQFVQAWTIRDGRAIRVHTFASLSEARRAVGLSE